MLYRTVQDISQLSFPNVRNLIFRSVAFCCRGGGGRVLLALLLPAGVPSSVLAEKKNQFSLQNKWEVKTPLRSSSVGSCLVLARGRGGSRLPQGGEVLVGCGGGLSGLETGELGKYGMLRFF